MAVMGAGAAAQVGAQLESLVQAGGGLVEGSVQRVTFRADDTGYTVVQDMGAPAPGRPPALAAAAAPPAAPPAKAGSRARRSAGARVRCPGVIQGYPWCSRKGRATRLLQPCSRLLRVALQGRSCALRGRSCCRARLAPSRAGRAGAKHGTITVVGALPHAAVGQTLRFAGAWGAHEKFGVQLRAARCEEIAPQSREALAAYLAGSALPGAHACAFAGLLAATMLRAPYKTMLSAQTLQP